MDPVGQLCPTLALALTLTLTMTMIMTIPLALTLTPTPSPLTLTPTLASPLTEAGCCERWLYLFEDDIDVHPQVSPPGWVSG